MILQGVSGNLLFLILYELCYNHIMKNEIEKTYNLEEVKEFMNQYLDLSVARLRSRLKATWKKQVVIKRPLYESKI